MTADAADVARALTAAWRVFRWAAGDDAGGWDMAAAAAEVRPEAPLRGLMGVLVTTDPPAPQGAPSRVLGPARP